jgi:hypothetical protein
MKTTPYQKQLKYLNLRTLKKKLIKKLPSIIHVFVTFEFTCISLFYFIYVAIKIIMGNYSQMIVLKK